MIDIHHHLLYGLDDGSPNLATSVEMARLASADGITHVVCTPHANSQYDFDPATNTERLTMLRDRLAVEQIPLTLGLGADFHLSYDNIEIARRDPARFSINGLGYLLVELPDYGLPGGITETFYELQLAKSTPILTHPERNATLQADMSRMANWLRGGLLVQITGDSVLGKMGKKAEQMAHLLLSRRWVHFLATDAHSTRSRPPRMAQARAIVAKKYGEDYAQLLCVENPLAVFEGRALPEQQEPTHLYEFAEPRENWWTRLLSR